MSYSCSETWGKYDRENQRWLSLKLHCLDVSAVFRALCDIPTLHRSLDRASGSQLVDGQLDRLAVIAGIHDIGKANHGFQEKILPGSKIKAGHVREVAALFFDPDLSKRIWIALDFETLSEWFEGGITDLSSFLIAAFSHHGRPLVFDPHEKNKQYRPDWWYPTKGRDPLQTIQKLGEALRKAYPVAFKADLSKIPSLPSLQHLFAGLVMLADWLGSHQGFFPINRPSDSSFNYSKERAAIALYSVGLDVGSQQRELSMKPLAFEDLFGFSNLTPLQASIGKIAASADDNRLLIVEAETGSGKTEVALKRFFDLFATGEVEGLYFALPTRVAAKEIYNRVLGSIQNTFPDESKRPSVLLAVPGYVRVDGLNPMSILPGIESRSEDSTKWQIRERSWAAEIPKRFLAATIAVGTIDQALLSILQVPHAHLRSVCLDRHLLVVDEVHASDPYMRCLLRVLLEQHIGIGGHTLLLSATLGESARNDLLSATGVTQPNSSFQTACKTEYPAITNLTGSQLDVSSLNILKEKPVRFRLLPVMENMDSVIHEIQTALNENARVLVIHNTVARANSMVRAIEHSAIPSDKLFKCRDIPCPHHGRFAPADREYLDEAITNRFGKGTLGGPVVIVGTQTLEQSLDIDADLLITDLCPTDVLLQRVGRLHRHKRDKRPSGFETPQCLILTPMDQTLDSYIDNRGEPTGPAMRLGLGSVYTDLRSIRLTIETLSEKSEFSIPKDNRFLVESATNPSRLTSIIGERWRAHGINIEGIQSGQRMRAQFASLKDALKLPFGEFRFAEPREAEIRTRLGLDNRFIRLSKPIESPFGISLNNLVIPGHLVRGGSGEETAQNVNPFSGGFTFSFGKNRYQYTRFGLEIHNESTD